jgi:hypothetical protein
MAAREELPKFIDKGRQQVTGQMMMARMMGEYAVKEGQKEAEKLVKQAQDRLGDLAGGPARPAPSAAPSPAREAAAAAPSEQAPTPTTAAAPSNGNGSRAKPSSQSTQASGAELAIPGYDTLSASQVVTRLAGLSTDELEAVRAYELATRHRKTILSRVAQLQTGAPA